MSWLAAAATLPFALYFEGAAAVRLVLLVVVVVLLNLLFEVLSTEADTGRHKQTGTQT